MYERTTWTTRHDGLTHCATIRGNDLDGFEVRSDCGIVSHVGREELSHEGPEITCPSCRKAGNPSIPTPGTGAKSLVPRSPGRPGPGEDDADDPKTIGEVLDEMGFPTRQASQKDGQRASCSD